MAFDPSNLNFKKQLSSLIGFDKYGIDQMRSVEWGRKYLWAVRFLNAGRGIGDVPPAPFNDFFPASDVEFPIVNLNSFNFELGQSGYRIPQRSESRQISITFFDDINSNLLKWFRDWIEIDILNRGRFISCLNDNHYLSEIDSSRSEDSFGLVRRVHPTRVIQIEQLLPDLEPTGISYNLYVYPEGEINFTGASASEATTYTVNFVIVGEKDQAKIEKNSKQESKLKQTGIKTLGRFI